MRLKYFLLALFTLPFATIIRSREPMSVYVTNNGEIALKVNGLLIPANPMDTDRHPIRAVGNTLIISDPRYESQHAIVKLLDKDDGTTIQIGSHGDAVDVLRSDKVGKRLQFKSNKKFPKPL